MSYDGTGATASQDERLSLAASRIGVHGLMARDEQRDAAVALLAALYATGLRHGITPEQWDAEAGLAIECVDAIRWRDRAKGATCTPRRRPARGLVEEPGRTTHREGRGR
jgi:hypothetical protein